MDLVIKAQNDWRGIGRPRVAIAIAICHLLVLGGTTDLCATVSTVKKIPRYSVVSWRYFSYYVNRYACWHSRKI